MKDCTKWITPLLIMIIGLGTGLLFLSAAPSAKAYQPNTNDVTYRFVNLSDAPLDLYRNDRVAFFGVERGVPSSERVINANEAQNFRLFTENADLENDSPLRELDLTFEPDTYILLVAYSSGEDILLEAYTRDVSAAPVNLARVQVIHLADGTPSLNVSGQNQDVLLPEVMVGAPMTVEIPAGNYQLRLTDATNPESEALTNLALEATQGTHVTLLVHGNETLRTTTLTSSIPVTGLFRFVHAGRLADQVDVYLNETLVFSNVGYQMQTVYTEVPPATYTASIYPAGAMPADGEALWQGPVNISENFAVTGVAMGDLNLRLLTYVDDLEQIPAASARLRVINAALNIPLLTVVNAESEVIFGGIEYALGSRNLLVEAGTQTLTFKVTDGPDVVNLSDVTLEANHIYTYVLVGNALFDDSVVVIPVEWNWQDRD